MLDASLGSLVSSIVLAENDVNAAEQIIDSDVIVTGSTTDFSSDSLTISTSGGSEDNLSINDEGTGAGQIGVSGTNISYEGTVIGTLSSNGASGSNLQIDLNANATKIAIENLIENITYRNTSDTPTVNRTINVSLGSHFSENVTVTVAPENDAPTAGNNTGSTVAEGGSVTLLTSDLSTTDPDNATTDLVYTITNIPSNGQLELSTNTGVAITSFTQDDINNNRLVYVHDASNTTTDTFDYTVTDGTDTLTASTFNMTITPFDDAPVLTTNTGTDVSLGFSVSIGAEPSNFGTEVGRQGTVGEFANIQGIIDGTNVDTQLSLVFTTPTVIPTAIPGQVLFESGGSGRGIGLYLNNNNELAWHIGNATVTPRLLSDAPLLTNTQYAVVIEIDDTNNEIRMHYEQASNHNWFYFGRAAESELTGFTETDFDGGNNAGLGVVGGGSYGGFNGSVSGVTAFQGTIDSDLVLTRFPTAVNANTQLVVTDTDDADSDLIYTITDDVDYGAITRAGVILGLGDTFTQNDLNAGIINYDSTLAPVGPSDSFSFDVFDGTTTLSDTFVINVNTVNTAPVIYDEINIYSEDFTGGTSGWNRDNATTTNDPVVGEYWGRFNRNINVTGNQELHQTFGLSGSQEYVTVEFDFLEIDSWDNEYFYVFVDDVQIRSDRLRWNVWERPADRTSAGDIDSRVTELTNDDGYAIGRDIYRDQIYHYEIIIPTTASTFKLGFGTSLNSTNFNDESFGLDNIVINELRETGGTNTRSIGIAETIRNGETVTQILANDPDAGQTLTYAITGGTGTSAFSIDAATGEIRVTDESLIDFESGTTSFTLDIEVTDNGPGLLTDTQTLTINILDALENTRPNIDNQTFYIPEDITNNSVVGTLATSDPEGDGIELYQIIGGNSLGIFNINSATGEIRVIDNSTLNFENDPIHSVRFRVWDDNDLGLYHDRTIQIRLTNVDDAPTLDPEFIGENAEAGIVYSSATGNYYKYVTSATNLANATANAAADTLNGVAGRLLTVESAAEKAFIRSITDNHVWLGISDAAVEGEWRYTTGDNTGLQLWDGRGSNNGGGATNGFYTDWRGTSEPNSGTSNNGAVFYRNDGRWVDVNVNSNYRYVIEWEGTDIVNNDTYYVTHNTPDAAEINNGYSVGFVQGLDPEGDTLTYTIQSGNDDGIFAINPTTGEITVVDDSNLDASVTDTFALTVRVTEDNGLNQFDEGTINIVFNEEIALTANTPHSAAEGLTSTITSAELNVSLGENAASDIVFDIDTFPANGQLQLSTNPGVGIIEFTLDDILNNRVQYVHGGAEIATDSFTFNVTDGGQTLPTATFNINVDPVNDAPTIQLNTGATVTEGGSITLTNAMLDALDIDDTATGLTYTASNYVRGSIQVSGVTQSTFTQDDIDNNRVTFISDGSESGTARFDITLADGGEDSAGTDSATFNLTVTPVNDSPLITTNTGFSVVEGGATTITPSILNTTDPDDSGNGLTYSASNIVGGQLQLTTNPGIPVLAFTQGDINSNRLIFVHDGGEQNASFDVSVVDGGENSATSDSASVAVTRIPVNDSPVISRNLGSTINAGSISLIKTAVLDAADPDDSGAGLTYTVSNFVNGQVELLSNPNVAITSFTQVDLQNSQIVFRHDNSFTTSASFDMVLSDGGEDSATTDSGTFSFVVDNTNDAPLITTNNTGAVTEGGHSVLTTSVLDSFDPDDFGVDLTYTVSGEVNGHIAFTSDLATPITSFTQADLDNGIVAFVHDGGETLTARFDVVLADGGENSAAPDSATVNLNVTAVNDPVTLIVNDGSPNLINFNDYTIETFDPSQDGQFGRPTTATVSPDGSELELAGNVWKKFDINYTLTADTVLSFEFRTDNIQEIHGIGFDDDTSIADSVFGFQLAGTQVWGGMDQTFRTYQEGDGWVRFDIPVGSTYTGAIQNMIFVLDDDGGDAGNGVYRNVAFYENNLNLEMNEGATFNITNAHLTHIDPDDGAADVTFTASNLTNGVVQVSGTTQTTFTQDDINNNRVTFVHDGTDTLNAGFDISLIDGGENGATADTGRLDIIVNPIDDASTVTANNAITLNEGAFRTLTPSDLNAVDVDTIAREVVFNIAPTPTNGFMALSTSPTTPRTSFTLADIQNGRVRYVHSGGENTSDTFDFTVTDGTSTTVAQSFDITITPVNDATQITTNNTGTLAEGGTLTIANTLLNITDPDDGAADVTYTTSNPINGVVQVSGVNQNTFTQDDINNNRVTFVHNGGETSTASFDISVIDGGENSAAADTATFNMNVTPVNDAPTLTTNVSTTVNEGEFVTLTTSNLNVTDTDNIANNLTFNIAPAPSNGFVALSSAPATPVTSFTLADIQNGDVRYVHNGGETTSDGFDFTVTDGALATANASFGITINPINDATVLITNTGASGFEDGAITITNAHLNATDTDDADTDIFYTATNLSNGHIEVNGITTNLFTQNDINNNVVRFIHDGSETTSSSFDIVVIDGGENGAMSTNAAFNINITPVNDNPHAMYMSNDTISERESVGTLVGTLSADDVDLPGDTITYSIMADPDGKFAITGDRLVLQQKLTFLTANTHSVTIRAFDGTGFMDSTFTINVEQFTEAVITSPDDGGADTPKQTTKKPTSSDFGRNFHNFTFGDESARISSFYGEANLGQIIRQNTTFEIQNFLNENSDNQFGLQTLFTSGSDLEGANSENRNTELSQSSERYTRMVDFLRNTNEFSDNSVEGETVETSSGETDSETPDLSIRNIEQNFDDILAYHEQRANKLRDVLLKDDL